MRPGGTQTKRGTTVRMRRRLGLAPRTYALLSCSLALVVAGVSAYGMTVPSMVQAHAAREAHVGSKAKGDLGTTTGYAWASVVAHVVFGVDDADGAEAPDNEVTLPNEAFTVLTVQAAQLPPEHSSRSAINRRLTAPPDRSADRKFAVYAQGLRQRSALPYSVYPPG